MPTHKHDDEFLSSHEPEEIDASRATSRSDVKVTGIIVFLTALAIFVAVIGRAVLRHRQGDQRAHG